VSGSQITVLLSEVSRMHGDLLHKAFYKVRDRFDVVACVGSTAEILAALQERRPEVAVISCDLQDGPLAGMRILPAIRTAHPDIRILLTMESRQRELVIDAFKSGADGVFCRSDLFESLCKAIESISQGQIWANSEELHYVLNAFAKSPQRLKIKSGIEKHLTKREAAVVDLAVEGVSNREIAGQLGLTEHTVKNYLFTVFEKLGVSNRVELVLFCLRQEQEAAAVPSETAASPRKAMAAAKRMVPGK
jgi:two-component system nitrate/nitrite response regulator NarL